MSETDVAARLAEALTRMWEDDAGEPLDELDVFAETRDAYVAALLPVVREIADQRAMEQAAEAARLRETVARVEALAVDLYAKPLPNMSFAAHLIRRALDGNDV